MSVKKDKSTGEKNIRCEEFDKTKLLKENSPVRSRCLTSGSFQVWI